MENIEEYETPESLLAAAVQKIRQSNRPAIYRIPAEASDRQEEILGQELASRHPWQIVILVTYPGTAPQPNGGICAAPKIEEPYSLDELRKMITGSR